MKIKYVIQNIETNKFFDWYGCEIGFEGDLEEIRNGLYNTFEEAEKELMYYSNDAELYNKTFTIIKIYTNN